MPYITILKLAIAVTVGTAFVSHLILYIAFKAHKVPVSFPRSVKPGYAENLYHQTPNMRSPMFGAVLRLATLSKILAVAAVIAFFIASSALR